MISRLVAASAGALSGTPYHLVVIPEIPGQSLLDPVRYVVETRSADAVIFNRIQPQDPRVAYLREKGFPFVTHGRSDWHADHAWFDYDNDGFGRRAVAHLARRGWRNLLLIAPPATETYGPGDGGGRRPWSTAQAGCQPPAASALATPHSRSARQYGAPACRR